MAIALAIVAIGGLLFVVLGWLGLTGRPPRNGFAGIRTPYTMKSDQHWYAAHRYGAPMLIFGGVAVFMTGLAFFPFSVAGKVPSGLGSAVTMAMTGLLLLSALISWQTGVKGAKRELGER